MYTGSLIWRIAGLYIGILGHILANLTHLLIHSHINTTPFNQTYKMFAKKNTIELGMRPGMYTGSLIWRIAGLQTDINCWIMAGLYTGILSHILKGRLYLNLRPDLFVFFLFTEEV